MTRSRKEKKEKNLPRVETEKTPMKIERKGIKIEEAVKKGDVTSMREAVIELEMLIEQASEYKKYLKEEIRKKEKKEDTGGKKVKGETKEEIDRGEKVSPSLEGGYGVSYKDARECGFKINDRVIIRNFVKVPGTRKNEKKKNVPAVIKRFSQRFAYMNAVNGEGASYEVYREMHKIELERAESGRIGPKKKEW